ncbi:MAG: type II toxin-antitoxin system RelE/ParE family toxin [Gammaproteobacteria bacterium]|nr:type II toxin-antitoxin system RelE/ParE family toxin [Gammaproteobacteria bacterium]
MRGTTDRTITLLETCGLVAIMHGYSTSGAVPRLGRRLPRVHARGELREVFVSGYRIMYRVNSDGVMIAAIIHGARRLSDVPDLQE